MSSTIEPPRPTPPGRKTSSLAVWSLALGILGLGLLLLCVGPIFAIPAVICGHVAYSRINRSGGELAGQGMALAGIITGYISVALSLFVIPMLLAIAVPNFVRARKVAQTNACIRNLKVIDAAKHEWALEKWKKADDTPTIADLVPYAPEIESLKCPVDGTTYTLNSVGEKPTCSVEGHDLADSPNP